MERELKQFLVPALILILKNNRYMNLISLMNTLRLVMGQVKENLELFPYMMWKISIVKKKKAG